MCSSLGNMKYIIPTIIAVIVFVLLGIGTALILGPKDDRLPADYGMDNEPVEVCIADGVVVTCSTPVEVGGGK